MCRSSSSSGDTPGWFSGWRNSHRRKRQINNRGANFGIQIASGSVPPPWRNGFVPHHAGWWPAWPVANWGTPWTGTKWGEPVLPARQPDHNVWSFPTGDLTWTPHQNEFTHWLPIVGTPIARPVQPFPNDGRPKFAPWLALNPFQPDMPMLHWDVRQHPVTTRLTTGAHISTTLEHALYSPATDPPVSIIEIAIQACSMAYLWNVVRVQRAGAIRVTDILDAVYDWLQIPLTQAEMEHIERVSPASAEAILSAFYERSYSSPALCGWEYRHGPRRIDCLGDVRRWMGLSYSRLGQGMQLVLNLQPIPRL